MDTYVPDPYAPHMFQKYLWYKKNTDLNSPDTIHNILAYSNLSAIKDVKKAVGEEKLKEIFLASPQKVYSPSGLNFITKFILHSTETINESRYLKTTPRYIG